LGGSGSSRAGDETRLAALSLSLSLLPPPHVLRERVQHVRAEPVQRHAEGELEYDQEREQKREADERKGERLSLFDGRVSLRERAARS
jgi:hypothetical protein